MVAALSQRSRSWNQENFTVLSCWTYNAKSRTVRSLTQTTSELICDALSAYLAA